MRKNYYYYIILLLYYEFLTAEHLVLGVREAAKSRGLGRQTDRAAHPWNDREHLDLPEQGYSISLFQFCRQSSARHGQDGARQNGWNYQRFLSQRRQGVKKKNSQIRQTVKLMQRRANVDVPWSCTRHVSYCALLNVPINRHIVTVLKPITIELNTFTHFDLSAHGFLSRQL